jgi:hypothetical protein
VATAMHEAQSDGLSVRNAHSSCTFSDSVAFEVLAEEISAELLRMTGLEKMESISADRRSRFRSCYSPYNKMPASRHVVSINQCGRFRSRFPSRWIWESETEDFCGRFCIRFTVRGCGKLRLKAFVAGSVSDALSDSFEPGIGNEARMVSVIRQLCSIGVQAIMTPYNIISVLSPYFDHKSCLETCSSNSLYRCPRSNVNQQRSG